jgi:hypothetical protein
MAATGCVGGGRTVTVITAAERSMPIVLVIRSVTTYLPGACTGG